MLLFERDRGSNANRRARGVRRFEAGVEAMEGRRLLTGSGALIFLSGTTVEIYGSNNGDAGVVSMKNGSVDVSVSNAQGSDDVQFPASQVTSIQYFGGSGSNNFANDTSLTGYLYGGSGNNVLTGGSGSDYLFATSGGTNVLNAGSGFEVIEALGPGNNTLNGGSGFTEELAIAGNNQLVGGAGNTSILAFGGQNVIDGGAGYTTVYSFSSTDMINANARTTVYKFY
jgi:hypothetical protein